MSIAATLHRIGQAYTRELLEADSPLTDRQIMILDALVDNPGASQTHLCSVTSIDRSTLADVMARLFKGRLVTRTRTRADYRAYSVHITDDGREALAKAKRARRAAERNLMEQFPGLRGLAA